MNKVVLGIVILIICLRILVMIKEDKTINYFYACPSEGKNGECYQIIADIEPGSSEKGFEEYPSVSKIYFLNKTSVSFATCSLNNESFLDSLYFLDSWKGFFICEEDNPLGKSWKLYPRAYLN